MENFNHIGQKEIFCRFIRKNGQIIYPKNGKLFHFWVDDINEKLDSQKQISMFDDEAQN